MTLPQIARPNAYTGSPLDRVSARRDDEAWVASCLADPASRFVPLWRNLSLLRDPGTRQVQPAYLDPAGAAGPIGAGAPWVLLGLREGDAVFALDLGEAEDAPSLPPGAGVFEDLRQASGALAAADASVLAHARGMMHWRRRHRFCGICGTACAPRSAGNMMACPSCDAHHFPRTDPAVIMLVTRDDHALLGHSQRFPRTTMYSTLAGFVEPGESLEEAVAREVAEESGIRTGRVTYHSSQPWPFPASIMLGFYAEAESGRITIDPHELRDARWFARAEIADPEAHGFHLPRADSIARRLIEDWLHA